MKNFFLLSILFLNGFWLLAQQPDTVPGRDTGLRISPKPFRDTQAPRIRPPRTDTNRVVTTPSTPTQPVTRPEPSTEIIPDTLLQDEPAEALFPKMVSVPPHREPVFNQGSDLRTILHQAYRENLFIGFARESRETGGDIKQFQGKEGLFYFLIGLLLFFGLLRRMFEKYFIDLFRVFFKTTLKQRQVREQLLQSPLPSVMMNFYFVLSAGFYINLLLDHYQLELHENFWIQYLYCMGGLSAIYIVKFVGLKLTGWLFNVPAATDSYTFIVFLINKMIGLFLLPFILILAFSENTVFQVALVLSWIGIGLLYLYRLMLSYAVVRNEIRLNILHFLLYLIAFEVVPLLVLYKLIIRLF